MGPDPAQGAEQFDRFVEPPGNGVIAVSRERGAPLRRLLEAQIAAFNKQVDVGGPEVVLDPATALTFATVIKFAWES